ncbi:hypothetical protein TNIN_427761 [Trichonephila inaurata madagascariensis]|uniref:Uncharacterized protein n=1 Tax=Trichonephila inaurata madagascariensis TaxID=2747483 RepID=A0A8X6XDB6_9ARAC|nr:hypothetical protein TNIN_427761 [Trichonephila inaurata madagascariensis]
MQLQSRKKQGRRCLAIPARVSDTHLSHPPATLGKGDAIRASLACCRSPTETGTCRPDAYRQQVPRGRRVHASGVVKWNKGS